MAFDYWNLKRRIKEKFHSQTAFCKALGMADATFSTKVNGKAMFTVKEIMKMVELLDIDLGEIGMYFFQVAC